MKIVCENKIINLDKFESVCYRKCYFSDEFVVNTERWEKE